MSQTGGLKVAGVLIESAPPYVLIGIGVNIRQAPTVDTTGAERGKCITLVQHALISIVDTVPYNFDA
jgi:biotin-(acetyl-CoA carboxylase) ligase